MAEKELVVIHCLKCDCRRIRGISDDKCPVCEYEAGQAIEVFSSAMEYERFLDRITQSAIV